MGFEGVPRRTASDARHRGDSRTVYRNTDKTGPPAGNDATLENMSAVALHFASGAAFFTGAACLVAGMLAVAHGRHRFVRPAGRLLFLLGLFAIATSATPLPTWAYGIWAANLLFLGRDSDLDQVCGSPLASWRSRQLLRLHAFCRELGIELSTASGCSARLLGSADRDRRLPQCRGFHRRGRSVAETPGARARH